MQLVCKDVILAKVLIVKNITKVGLTANICQQDLMQCTILELGTCPQPTELF